MAVSVPPRLHESDPALPNSLQPLASADGVTNPMLIYFSELDPQNPPDKIALTCETLADALVEPVVVGGACTDPPTMAAGPTPSGVS